MTDTNPIAVNQTSLSVTGGFEIVVHEVNSAPILILPANANINELVAFAALATATDADVPTNGLAFSLVNPPTGAAISSAGAFTWRPGVALANTTNVVQVHVLDGGVPPLSDTMSFLVAVGNLPPVVLTPLGYSNGAFQIQVAGAAGPDYIIEASTNLTTWSGIATNLSPATPFQFLDPAATSSHRAYRARLQP